MLSPQQQAMLVWGTNRAFLLERGVAVRQGLRFLRNELPSILAAPSDALSPRMVRIIEDLAGDWRQNRTVVGLEAP